MECKCVGKAKAVSSLLSLVYLKAKCEFVLQHETHSIENTGVVVRRTFGKVTAGKKNRYKKFYLYGYQYPEASIMISWKLSTKASSR